jgi:hypothetical protein
MTRAEAEHAIMRKVHEIKAILAQYSGRDNLMICIWGDSCSFWNCQTNDIKDVLDCSEHAGDVTSWEHKEGGTDGGETEVPAD